MRLNFLKTPLLKTESSKEWGDWRWQFRHSYKSLSGLESVFGSLDVSAEEYKELARKFRVQTTPYYASLALGNGASSIRKMIVPSALELKGGAQEQYDPLGERKKKNRVSSRLVHRYSDRVLLLVTDLCSVYCRYCTRKNFTATDEAFIKKDELKLAIDYIKSNSSIREVILSGGDPLTISNSLLDQICGEIRQIDHVELIRIHTRMPVVCPMRIDTEFIEICRKHKPVYVITHFNHPKEISYEAAISLESMVDSGIPVLNQMVLLNGVNNHAAIVHALSRRLLYLRVKPYYMFQCDPSEGSDHLRTSIDESLAIQKELWGHISGLAMPNYIIDLPNGGGKMSMAPNFEVGRTEAGRQYRGWDGVEAEYLNPCHSVPPEDVTDYSEEWQQTKSSLRNQPNLFYR